VPQASFFRGSEAFFCQSTRNTSRAHVSIEPLHDAGLFWWVTRAAMSAQAMRRSALEIEGSDFVYARSPLWLHRWASNHIPCREDTLGEAQCLWVACTSADLDRGKSE